MQIAKLSTLGMASLGAGLVFLLGASPALAQNCYPTHSAGFARLKSAENRAATAGAADMEVRALFGPRQDLCEEGAYKNFLDSFESFTKEAMRAKPPHRDNLLRLAIAAIKQAPIKVPFKEKQTAPSQWRQLRSNLNATADDVGFEKTPLLNQVLEALTSMGPPTATAAPSTPPEVVQAPTTGTNAPSGAVLAIRIPVEPMPNWAIIKLYEMRDNVKSQDLAAIQIKLQDIINWVETSTKAQP